MNSFITFIRERNWLTAAALWVVVFSWAAAGVWGWSQTTAGIITPVLMALTIAAQVAGARMIAIAANATIARRIALIILALGAVIWSGYAGKRAIETSEAQRLAPSAAYEVALTRVEAAEAAIAAVPAVPLVDSAGRMVGPQRLAVLQEARAAEIARLAAERDAARAALPEAPATAQPMPEALTWVVAILVEALELFGFWAIGAGHVFKKGPKPKRSVRRVRVSKQPAQAKEQTAIAYNAARELAMQRWSKVKSTKTA